MSTPHDEYEIVDLGNGRKVLRPVERPPALGWTPAREGDTPGQVEPDEGVVPQPVDLIMDLEALALDWADGFMGPQPPSTPDDPATFAEGEAWGRDHESAYSTALSVLRDTASAIAAQAIAAIEPRCSCTPWPPEGPSRGCEVHGEAAEVAELRAEVERWRSGRRVNGLRQVESVPDGLQYAARAELAEAKIKHRERLTAAEDREVRAVQQLDDQLFAARAELPDEPAQTKEDTDG